MPRIVLGVILASILTISSCSSSEPAAEQTAGTLTSIKINYPNRSGSQWPLFLAKEGGYYEKYGLSVDLEFGVHPTGIAMLTSGQGSEVNSSLEQMMQAASKDGSLSLVGSSLNRGTFALMASPTINDMSELKGQRIAVSQIGDAPYGYVIALLDRAGLTSRDVEWIPVGQGVSARMAALTSGRVDATLLTAPVYFRAEDQGYHTLANLAERQDIFASTAYTVRTEDVQNNPDLVESLIKAQAEAIKRFYEDKEFAVNAYLAYDPEQSIADIERIWEMYSRSQALERIPYVLQGAVDAVIAQQADPQIAEQMKAYDFSQVINNSFVDRLVQEGFFEELYGPEIVSEQESKAAAAFGR